VLQADRTSDSDPSLLFALSRSGWLIDRNRAETLNSASIDE